MRGSLGETRNYGRLFEVAAGQAGLFTTQQAAAVGYSPQLLAHHVKAGNLRRVQRGIYRLVHFPANEHEELFTAWLWSERVGVISHETALVLHGLAEGIAEARRDYIHLTLPDDWRRRRLRSPDGVILHFADLRSEDWTLVGTLPTTSAGRTITECLLAIPSEQLQRTCDQALARGLASEKELAVAARVVQGRLARLREDARLLPTARNVIHERPHRRTTPRHRKLWLCRAG